MGMLEQMINILNIIASSKETADIIKDSIEAYNDIKDFQDQIYESWSNQISTEDGRGHTNFPGLPIEHAHSVENAQHHIHSRYETEEGTFNYCWVNVAREDVESTHHIVGAITASQKKLLKNSNTLKMLERHNRGTVRKIYQNAWKKVEKRKNNSKYL